MMDLAEFQKPLRGIYSNVSNCKYSVVKNCMRARNHKLIEEKGVSDDLYKGTSGWNLWWQDTSVATDRVAKLRAHQRVNHWPGMSCLHTKTGLADTLRRLQQALPADYDFFPETWVLPNDFRLFTQQFDPDTRRSKGNKTFIVKPAADCQGRGIFLTRRLDEIDPRTAQVAQRYIAKPFLVDGLKFDMRIYILVTSVDPLRVWLHEEGLCRFATTRYAPPSGATMQETTMHLTNYAINKDAHGFVFNTDASRGDTGSKRTLTWFRSWLDSHGHSSTAVWGSIVHVILKMLLAAQPHLASTYRSVVPGDGGSMRCFEVLGLDVILDSHLRPFLLEVNHSPSLSCDSPLDLDIKTRVVGETIDLLRLRAGDRRRTKEEETSRARSRLYSQGSEHGSIGASAVAVAECRRGLIASTTTASASVLSGGTVASTRPGSASARIIGASSALSDATLSCPPPHVGTTAAAFSHCAAAIPEDHARHEVKVAKGFRLIFPPPDPALVSEDVWSKNAAGQARMAAGGYGIGTAQGDKAGGELDAVDGAKGPTISAGAGTGSARPPSTPLPVLIRKPQSTYRPTSAPANVQGVQDLATEEGGLAVARAALVASHDSEYGNEVNGADIRARAKWLKRQLDEESDGSDDGDDDDDDASDTEGEEEVRAQLPVLARPHSAVPPRPPSALGGRVSISPRGSPVVPSPPPAPPRGNVSLPVPAQTSHPMQDGVPRPFYPPWDVSVDAYTARLSLYCTCMTLSAHTYASGGVAASMVAGSKRVTGGSGAGHAEKIGTTGRKSNGPERALMSMAVTIANAAKARAQTAKIVSTGGKTETSTTLVLPCQTALPIMAPPAAPVVQEAPTVVILATNVGAGPMRIHAMGTVSTGAAGTVQGTPRSCPSSADRLLANVTPGPVIAAANITGSGRGGSGLATWGRTTPSFVKSGKMAAPATSLPGKPGTGSGAGVLRPLLSSGLPTGARAGIRVTGSQLDCRS